MAEKKVETTQAVHRRLQAEEDRRRGDEDSPEDIRAKHPPGAMISEPAPMTPPTPLDIPESKAVKVGAQGDYPTVLFDEHKRKMYVLSATGERIYQDPPEGWHWTKKGELVLKESSER